MTNNMALPPPGVDTTVSNSATGWNIYRTRFLIKAKQLDEPLVFIDPLGREQRGQAGDYLIESSDGRRSIQRREIFEDVYVPMGPPPFTRSSSRRETELSTLKRQAVTRPAASA